MLFGILIFVHELGHYIAARLCKVKVIEFAIGMGPKLIKWQSKKTDIKYSIRLLPLGGFCSMEGEGDYSNPAKPDDSTEAEPNESEPEEATTGDDSEPAIAAEVTDAKADTVDNDPHSYRNKPAWMKIIILTAGPLMNIIIGFLMTFVLVISLRDSNGDIQLASNTVAGFDTAAISAQTGLCEGDTVVKVGNTSIHTGQELVYEITMQGKDTGYYEQFIGSDISIQRLVVSVDLTVIRNGEKILLENVKFLASNEQGSVFGNADFYVLREKTTFGNVIKQSWFRSLSSVKMVWDSLIGMITGRFALSSVSGPVGATQVITEAARTGWYTLLYIFIIIAMNLGIFNLLPILPLDGGHIVFAVYELIFRKPASKKVETVCQLIGVILMFGLMIVVTIKDVINLFI